MKVACLGGGPAGLYFAISMKLHDATHDVTVHRLARPGDRLRTSASFIAMEQRSPGGYTVMKLEKITMCTSDAG